MSPITLEPGTGYAAFGLRPSRPGRPGPPVELVLSAPGYRATAHVPGGYPGGAVALPVASPSRTVERHRLLRQPWPQHGPARRHATNPAPSPREPAW